MSGLLAAITGNSNCVSNHGHGCGCHHCCQVKTSLCKPPKRVKIKILDCQVHQVDIEAMPFELPESELMTEFVSIDMPAGMSLDTASKMITGTPTALGVSTINIMGITEDKCPCVWQIPVAIVPIVPTGTTEEMLAAILQKLCEINGDDCEVPTP